ncbi:uncharacterized protein LOC141537275 isoform X1 [Cotesia typhae]|uniref:uncharacterized protein LOC141537275 isoform X1 n=1 Tax=Cotesia typhae TaxID=2053667 RepID=UPI003D68E57C
MNLKILIVYKQAITRRLKKLGLIRLVQSWKYGKILIRKIMALALLPAVDASDGFQWIITNIPDNVKTLFGTFLLYFHEQWIEKTPPTLWSVYGLLHRTDNLAETYHKKANLRFGAHSPIWKFTENLTALQAVTHIEYLSLRNGDNIVRPRSSRTQKMDVKIVKVWQLFNDNILDVPHFLACASNFLQSFQREITHNVVIQHDCDQQSNVFDSDDSIMKNNYDNHLVFLELDIMQNY